MRAVLGSNFVSGQRWSSRCSTWSRAAISAVSAPLQEVAVEWLRVCHLRPANLAADPIDLFAGQLLACADLVDDVRWRLGQERVVAELSFGACQFPSQPRRDPSPACAVRRRPSTVARRVEFDDNSALRQPHLDGGRGAEPLVALREPRQRPHGGGSARPGSAFSMSDSRAGTRCRSLRPWSLRNRRTSVISFCMSATRCAAAEIQFKSGRLVASRRRRWTLRRSTTSTTPR